MQLYDDEGSSGRGNSDNPWVHDVGEDDYRPSNSNYYSFCMGASGPSVTGMSVRWVRGTSANNAYGGPGCAADETLLVDGHEPRTGDTLDHEGDHDWRNLNIQNRDNDGDGDTQDSLCVKLTAADLTAGTVSPASATAGSAVTLTAQVRNSGPNSTGSGFTDLFQRATSASGANATDIGTYTSGALSSGNTNTASISTTFGSGGTWYVRSCADKSNASDAYGVIAETDENNNCGAWTGVTVSAAPVNHAPTISISGPTTGYINTDYTFTVKGTDQDHDQVTNAIDWDGDGNGPYQGTPYGNYLNSGTADVYQHQWSTAGSHTFVAKTQDSKGASSAWKQYTISLSAPVVPPDLTAVLIPSHQALNVVTGQVVNLDATVSNIGGGPTGAPFYTTFWTNTQQSWTGVNARYSEFNSGVPNGFNAGASETDGPQLPVTRTFTTPGTYYYQVCANRNHSGSQTVTQSNPNNDCSAWGTINVSGRPDLTASNSASVTKPAGTVTLSGTATNSGNGNSGRDFPATIFINDSSNNLIASFTSERGVGNPIGYAPGVSEAFTHDFTFATPGTYSYRTCADEDSRGNGLITESNEANNCGAWNTITITPFPDMTATVSSHAVAAVPGQTISLRGTIKNQGQGISGGDGMWNVFQVCDTNPGTGDEGVSCSNYQAFSNTWYSGNMRNGASVSVSASTTIPAHVSVADMPRTLAARVHSWFLPHVARADSSTITYYYRLCADWNVTRGTWTNTVTETNNQNDCSGWSPITVTPVVIPAPTCSLSASPADSVPATLTWNSTGATSCTAQPSSSFSTQGATSGSATVTIPGTYQVRCVGDGGSCISAATVGQTCINPIVSISAAPTRIQSGGTSVISYGASGVSAACTITGAGAPGSVAPASCRVSNTQFTTPPLSSQATYTITCGDATNSVIVNVVPKFSEF